MKGHFSVRCHNKTKERTLVEILNKKIKHLISLNVRVPRVRLADENSDRSGREGRVGNTQYTLNCSKYPVSHTRSFSKIYFVVFDVRYHSLRLVRYLSVKASQLR